MMHMAIITPVFGAIYLVWQIHKRDLRGWQHYACLTSLVFLVSILFLVGSGKVESFGLAGNTVKVVDQKLDEMRKLSANQSRLVLYTVDLAILATSPMAHAPGEGWNVQAFRDRVEQILRESDLPADQVDQRLERLDRWVKVWDDINKPKK